MLVFAGAGTGKTTVLENRYDHLINSGTAKDEILLTSFNKTAVAEIKERIEAVSKFENTHISTVHGLALKIVKENKAGELDVYDTETNEKQNTIENILQDILVNQNRRADNFKDLSIDEDRVSTTAEVLKNNIDLIRNQELTALENAEELIDNGYEIEKELYGEEAATLNNLEDLLKKTIHGFRQDMQENQRIDFVGMQFQAYKMLNENENILNKYQNRWNYIMVDEAQDLSLIQWKLLDLIAEDSNLALIGDDSQAIYGWRGSNYQFMHDFKDKYDADTITLDTSFRSTTQILDAVNDTCRELEGGVKEKILDSFEGEKETSEGHPKVSSFDTFEFDESKAIAYKIEQLLADGYEPDDIAVVSRTNYPPGLITLKLRNNNTPCGNEKP
jgi:superfamily I DNA/RNA helicase